MPEISEEEQPNALPTKLLDPSIPSNVKVRAVSATGRRGRRMSEDSNAAAVAAARSSKSPEPELKAVTLQRTRQTSNSPSPPQRTGRGRSSTVSTTTKPPIDHHHESDIVQTTDATSSKVFSNGERETLPPIVTKRRDRSKTVGVSTGSALDSSDSPISSKSLDKNPDEPRSLRFTFSLATTSTKDAKHILNELQRVLAEVLIEYRTEKFVTTCIIDDIEFEIEICKIPRLSLCGLRIKRLIGNSWDYKNVVSELVKKMDL